MLRGEKQVALFNQELGIPDAFLPYLELECFIQKRCNVM